MEERNGYLKSSDIIGPANLKPTQAQPTSYAGQTIRTAANLTYMLKVQAQHT